MAKLCLASEQSTIPVVGICSTPERFSEEVFHMLISLLDSFANDYNLFAQAVTFIKNGENALKECKIEDDSWHPIEKIEREIRKLKKSHGSWEVSEEGTIK